MNLRVIGRSTYKIKKKRKRTCIAPIVSITRPLSAQMWITQSYLQIHHICYILCGNCVIAYLIENIIADVWQRFALKY